MLCMFIKDINEVTPFLTALNNKYREISCYFAQQLYKQRDR